MNYKQVKKESEKLNEHNDCAVRATTLASGFSYDHVHRLYSLCGRKHRRGVKRYITDKVWKHLGLKVKPVQVKSKTVCTLERELRFGKYLVFTRGHLLALIDGVVQDWTKGRRHRVVRVYKVVDIAASTEEKS